VRRIIFRAAWIASSIAAATLAGGLAAAGQAGEKPPANAPAAEENAPSSRDAEIAQARETLSDMLASELIDRIDFEAETYEQGMAHIHATVDRILELNLNDWQDTTVLVHRASQVIEAFNSHKQRGLMLTFGTDLKKIPVRTPAEAHQLGELVGTTVSLIREQFREKDVSYHDVATKLFRSVVLDAEEGPFLEQYLDGIQRIADLPSEKRARYFH
jgi:hypothetical protein